MKALLINGSPHEKGCTYTALRELADTLEAEGIETEIVQAGKTAHACNACASCKKTHRCVYDDLVNETAPKFAEADALVIGSRPPWLLTTMPLAPASSAFFAPFTVMMPLRMNGLPFIIFTISFSSSTVLLPAGGVRFFRKGRPRHGGGAARHRGRGGR